MIGNNGKRVALEIAPEIPYGPNNRETLLLDNGILLLSARESTDSVCYNPLLFIDNLRKYCPQAYATCVSLHSKREQEILARESRGANEVHI